MSRPDKHLYEFGPFRLDTAEQLLLHEGRPVPLAGKAFETLVVLVRRSGQLVHKEELMSEVWPDTIVEENNLDKSISTLRKALGEGDAERKYIETVRGRGYRFAAGVRELSAVVMVKERTLSSITIEEEEEIDRDETVGQELCVTASTVKVSGLDLIKPDPLPIGRMIATGRSFVNRIKRSSKIVSVLAVALIAALAVTGYYVYSNRSDSIAVLPFTYTNADPNANSNPDSEYLSDGITEHIINNLSRLPGLKVIARSSVFHYKGQEVDPQVVGRELGVRTVLTGRIIQQGDSLTIKVD